STALAAGASAQERTVAFTNVSVVPMDAERVLADQTVVVRGDRIVQVGPAARVAVPAGATRIDGRGRFLLPGLAEMHGHVPPPNAPAGAVENTMFLYVAGGITTVRGMLGAPGQLALRERARRGEIVGPTLYLAGPSFNGNSVDSPASAERMVREQKAEGWDLLKVHPGLTREEYDAMARAAKAAGIRFGGHVPAEVGLLHAIEMGQETFDHLDGYVEQLNGAAGPLDPAALADVVRRTKAAGAWVVPTSALWETLVGAASLDSLRAMPELRYMPRQTVQGWTTAHENRLRAPGYSAETARRIARNRIEILRALHQGGVRVLMGTDAPQQFSVPGFSIHRELAKMAESGLTPFEILATGTRNVGEYFKGSDTFGLVAPGHRADLLLLDADPLRSLDALTRRSGVMVRGRWLPEAEIRAGLERIAAAMGG
ncbi:MAG TPA: amidohydrolase family protein, partial [Gemmatimonadaceae bacterium]|nr:amidohydrolase family protein [Gemmatimonadaceae bacterium]